MKQDTLYNRISEGKPLTDEEQAALVAFFGKGCQAKRIRALERAARIVPDITNYGIYSRVYLHEYEDQIVSYCAGQDYTAELRTVRECLTD